MSDFESFLEEQMKSEEFRREFEALPPDYELVLRGDVDPRNLANPRRLNGVPYTDYERGYNDGVIAAYWLTRSAKAVSAEPVVHAHWVMRGGRRYCSACGTMGCVTRDRDDFWYTVGTKRCPECGAHMDEEVAHE